MTGRRGAYLFSAGLTLAFLLCCLDGSAQLSRRERRNLRNAPVEIERPGRYRIEQGVRQETRFTRRDSLRIAAEGHLRDSLRFAGALTAADSMAVIRKQLDADRPLFLQGLLPEDSLLLAGALTAADTLRVHDLIRHNYRPAPAEAVAALDSLGQPILTRQDSLAMFSRRELRRMERAADTVRYGRFFRDSIPISRMVLISTVVPGFGQFYNQQYYKIPVLYAALGTTIALGLKQHNIYKGHKREYDYIVRYHRTDDDFRERVDPVQTSMIRHNTYRQLFFAGAIATYIYFLGDGAVNYQGELTMVKKATTLSTICPGAGQFYNRSYWKVPIVMGGFATMFYMVDWNNRGYQRFKLAYDLVTDDDPNTNSEFYWNGTERYSPDFLRNYRNMYRRNRDLCIILTGAFYLLNIVDAHVDAHLKDYDISDDLALTVEPALLNLYSMQRAERNVPGINIRLRF